ncbi:MAG TPA: DUF475 domain-containing protein [Marmoricola sp.]|jgi:hypothetical protein|nr:DUF475 domain-containing protein [Marmoricola sp.]
MMLRTFAWSMVATVAGLVLAGLYGGATGVTVTAILIVLEISLSFDNAVVNARVLERMSASWQRLFLTVGVLIAVIGMRLLFPLVLVGITAHLSPVHAWRLAMEKGDPDTPGTYGYLLHDAHPAIAAFGGMFLLMIFLSFLLDPDKDLHWLGPIERVLSKAGALHQVTVLVALVTLAGFALRFSEHREQVLLAGVCGLITYLAVDGLGRLFAVDAVSTVSTASAVLATGRAALMLFIYLEVLDTSFSFDGVIGAFAITADPVIIALGLGVGALYVRSLTMYLVRAGTLDDYVFLEHGAHWAIGALAVLLMLTIGHEIPEIVTGLIGVGFIGAAFAGSLRYNRARAA